MFKPQPRKTRFFSVRSRSLSLYGRRLIIFLLLLISASLVYWVIAGKGFTVRNLRCSREGEPCAEQVTAEIAKISGHPILTFDTEALSLKLRQADPSLQKAEVLIILPDTLEINLTGKQPFALVKTENSKSFFLCDRDGYLYALTDSISVQLPELILSRADFSLGQYLDQAETTGSLTLIETLQSQYISFTKIRVISASEVRVNLTNGSEALFSLEGDLNKQVTSLQQILAQATIALSPSLIDVRYAKPVISPGSRIN